MRAFTVNEMPNASSGLGYLRAQLEGMYEMMKCLKLVTRWDSLGVEFIREPKRGRRRGLLLPRVRIIGANGDVVAHGLFRSVVSFFGCDGNILDSESTASSSEPSAYAFVPHPNDDLKVGISCATSKQGDDREVFISFGDTRFSFDDSANAFIGEHYDEIPTLEEYFKSGRKTIPVHAPFINIGGNGEHGDVIHLNMIVPSHPDCNWLSKIVSITPLTSLPNSSSWNW